MMHITARWWCRWVMAWVVAGLALSGCASVPDAPREITLAAVVVDGERIAASGEHGWVRVQRQGRWMEGQTAMALQSGDLIETAARGYAVIRYPSGTEVYMRPDSRARIGSLVDAVGEFFAKIRGAFAIQTSFVRAGAEGTAYLVRAAPSGEATVVVFDGTVNVSSNTGAWPSMRLGPGAMTDTAPQATPRTVAAPAAELARTRAWVERMEALVPAARSGAGRGAAVAAGLAIAALIAVIAANRSGDDRGTPPVNAGRGSTADGASAARGALGANVPGQDTLPAPTGLTPGSPDAGAPTRMRVCAHTVFSWGPVEGAREYEVSIEAAAPRPQSWRPHAVLTTSAPRIAAGDRLAAGVNRWSVRARDAHGRAGAGSPFLHIACGNYVR